MNLVVQGPGLREADMPALAGVIGGLASKISESAFRIKAPARRDVADWCAKRRLDHAWMPEGRRLADLKLLAMDMDSTLITAEMIDELGDAAGKKADIAAITAAAMRGEIDYPESLRRRVAMLAGLKETVLEDVYRQRLQLTPGAEHLVRTCKANGIKLLLVSGSFTYFVETIAERLGFDYTISNTLEIHAGALTGRVAGTIVDADAKAGKFAKVAAQLKAGREQTVAIGDGANDLKMMAEAGTSVAFRAKPVVRAKATCALDYAGLDGVLNLFE